MKAKEEIINIIKESLSYIYCHNCNGNIEDKCEECHRKYMNWGISDECAEEIAKQITEN